MKSRVFVVPDFRCAVCGAQFAASLRRNFDPDYWYAVYKHYPRDAGNPNEYPCSQRSGEFEWTPAVEER